MKVEWQDMEGVALRDAVTHSDRRGTFVKLADTAGMLVDQVCASSNMFRGTVRGLHLQLAPFAETKRVWCTAGEVWDVLVDARPEMPTYGCWTAVHMSASAPALLDVPPGVAHGYQTLVDSSSVAYLITGTHHPASGRTIAWDDARLGITWPLPLTEISDSDRKGLAWPLS